MSKPTYEELEAAVVELTRDKERALYELDIMQGNGILNLPRLRTVIKGDQR